MKGLPASIAASAFAAMCVVASNACSEFSGQDAPGGEAGAQTDGGADATDGATDDAADDATEPPGIRCGTNECPRGTSCCMGAAEPTCASACQADTWTMECTGPSDCGSDTPDCCWDHKRAATFCTKDCAGFKVCAASSDCPATSRCAPATCEGKVSLRVCTKGTRPFVDYPGMTPECQPP